MKFTQTFIDLATMLTGLDMFGSAVTYHSVSGNSAYDPMTGAVAKVETTYNITAGIEQITRDGATGAQETTEIKAWIAATSVPEEPKTSDELEYGGKRWHCVAVNPEFSGDGQVIAWAATFRS